jgi:S-adenosylmethionine:tRNA ribosyltransferase-isomerase
MKTSDFDYLLLPELIAQSPIEPRDSSRLLVFNRENDSLEHSIFRDIGNFINPGDLLVLNQTRVIPARIFARKPSGGKIEILLLRSRGENIWECLVGGKGMKIGARVMVEVNGPEGEIIEELEGAHRLIHFSSAIELYLPRIGNVPLPPYIHQPIENPERYQTVYSRDPGSAAAPTAGLHFTQMLLQKLKKNGVNLAFVTLHVGLDTFAPVTEADPAKHKIHTEWCQLSAETAKAINDTRKAGSRIIAVGTTSVRTLESAALQSFTQHVKEILPYSGDTNLFITPGFQFKIVDAMITNFHLPMSSLIMLVSAFAGREKILKAYEVAMRERYRFYSFGDAMLIL